MWFTHVDFIKQRISWSYASVSSFIQEKKSSTLQMAVFVDAQKPNSDLKARP